MTTSDHTKESGIHILSIASGCGNWTLPWATGLMAMSGSVHGIHTLLNNCPNQAVAEQLSLVHPTGGKLPRGGNGR